MCQVAQGNIVQITVVNPVFAAYTHLRSPPAWPGATLPRRGKETLTLSRLNELFPRTAAKFGDTPLAIAQFEADLADHGWQASAYLFWHADDLMCRAASWRDSGNLFLSYRFSVLFYKFRVEYCSMAGRKPVEAKASRAKWVGFLDYRLSDDELMALDEWQPAVADIWARVDALITNGYRLALSYNKEFSVSTCTIMDDDASRKSGGYGLSSSDADGAMALKAALYKHWEILGGTWDSLLDAPLTRGRRG